MLSLAQTSPHTTRRLPHIRRKATTPAYPIETKTGPTLEHYTHYPEGAPESHPYPTKAAPAKGEPTYYESVAPKSTSIKYEYGGYHASSSKAEASSPLVTYAYTPASSPAAITYTATTPIKSKIPLASKTQAVGYPAIATGAASAFKVPGFAAILATLACILML